MIIQVVTCKIILSTPIYLIKQQALDADPKAIHQVNFTGNLNLNVAVFFIIKEVKETILDFSEGTARVL